MAIVGCEDGYGIRGVAQAFSQMPIPINLYAVDPRSLPDMEEYKDLLSQIHFSLTLNLQDPRKILWPQVQPDIVIFPRLWMADLFAFDAWKETIAEIAGAKPSLIIAGFPRVSSVIKDPMVLEDVLEMTAKLMYKRGQISSPDEIGRSTMGIEMPETSVLSHLLRYRGYEKRAIEISSDEIMAPYNLYGASVPDFRGNRESLALLDPYIVLTIHEDLVLG